MKHDPYYEAFAYTLLQERRSELLKPYYPRNSDLRPLGQHEHLAQALRYSRPTFSHQVLHPTVAAALKTLGKPKDWHLLVLEQPTTASDGVRVAYVRNEAKRQSHALCSDPSNPHLTATTATKYLARHWPHIKSDQIRNLCAAQELTIKVTFDLDEMVDIVRKASTYSCMKNFDEDEHPYRVYDPTYSWGLAYAQIDGVTVARALVNENYQCFVRTYGYENSSGITQSHPGLHHFLEDQGYSYEDEWPEGCEFAKIEASGGFIAPYLDPGPERGTHNCRRVTEERNRFVRSNCGELEWDTTNGVISEGVTCASCGDTVAEDTTTYVEDADGAVCSHCLDHRFTYAFSYNGHEYIDNDHVIEVEGEAYDSRCADKYSIVQLHDGDWADIDNTIYVDRENEYYLDEDLASDCGDRGLIVYVKSCDEYVLRRDCVWCLYNDEWIEDHDAISVLSGHVSRDDFDDYLLTLEREEVSEVCISCGDRSGEKLAMWDAFYAKNEAQAELV